MCRNLRNFKPVFFELLGRLTNFHITKPFKHKHWHSHHRVVLRFYLLVSRRCIHIDLYTDILDFDLNISEDLLDELLKEVHGAFCLILEPDLLLLPIILQVLPS